jgi:hypothetical protein
MRMLRFVCAMALVCGVCAVAKAQDFASVVIDPQPTISEITLITSPVFVVSSLAPCQANQLDGLSTSTFIGCFTGLNVSGQTLTSLQIDFPAIYLPGHVLDLPNCPDETQDIFAFSGISCGFTDSSDTEYSLTFTDPIHPIVSAPHDGDCDNDGDGGKGLNSDDISCDGSSIFTLAIGFPGEPDANSSDLPTDFTVVANTPEPNSFWLMSTGVLSIGLFGAYRRRLIVGEPRP